MKSCKCGSMAINPDLNGRGKDSTELCDVCYWKAKYKQNQEALQNVIRYLSCFTIEPPESSAEAKISYKR